MKKLKKDLFSNKSLEKRVNLSSIVGGNKSDAWNGYADTSAQDNTYDISLPKLRDIEPTSNKSDKPSGLF